MRVFRSNGLRRPFCAAPLCAIALFAFLAGPAGAAVGSLDDIQYWVGSGPNRAALVIDFNDGKADEALAWGFRWGGAATGEDLLAAVVAADPRLFAKRGAPNAYGTPLYGLGYDANGGGLALTPAVAFDAAGVAVVPDSSADGGVPADPADRYREGWFTGFWGYYVADTNPYGAGGAWTSPAYGAGGRALVDGGWDGYSFAPGFGFTDPGSATATAAPAPEPGAGALLVVAASLTALRRARRGARA